MTPPNPHLRMFLDGFDDGEVVQVGPQPCLASRLVSQGLVVEIIQPCADAVTMGERIAEAGRRGRLVVPQNGMQDAEALRRAQAAMRGPSGELQS